MHRRRDRRDVVRDAGTRLVVRHQHGFHWRPGPQPAAHFAGVGRLPPLDGILLDFEPEITGDLRVPLTKRADRDSKHAVAGRQCVDNRGLQPAGARAGEEQNSLLGAEHPACARFHFRQQHLELRAAVVNHRGGERPEDGTWQWGGAGHAQVAVGPAYSGMRGSSHTG